MHWGKKDFSLLLLNVWNEGVVRARAIGAVHSGKG